MYTGAMETTTQGTNECQGGMSDPAAMPHLILDPRPKDMTDNIATIVIADGAKENTVQMLSLDEEVQGLVYKSKQ